jgi:hypothetical protein
MNAAKSHEQRPRFVGRTLFLESRGTVSLGMLQNTDLSGLTFSARAAESAGGATSLVWLTNTEARAIALELLRCVDANMGLARLDDEDKGEPNVPNPFRGQGSAAPAPRADGSRFDPHPIDAPATVDTTPAPELGPLDCTRDGCGHIYDLHEEGRCAWVVYDRDGRALRCACLGFHGTPPRGRGHVPVSSR